MASCDKLVVVALTQSYPPHFFFTENCRWALVGIFEVLEQPIEIVVRRAATVARVKTFRATVFLA